MLIVNFILFNIFLAILIDNYANVKVASFPSKTMNYPLIGFFRNFLSVRCVAQWKFCHI